MPRSNRRGSRQRSCGCWSAAATWHVVLGAAERVVLPGIRQIAPQHARGGPDGKTCQASVVFVGERWLLGLRNHFLANQAAALEDGVLKPPCEQLANFDAGERHFESGRRWSSLRSRSRDTPRSRDESLQAFAAAPAGAPCRQLAADSHRRALLGAAARQAPPPRPPAPPERVSATATARRDPRHHLARPALTCPTAHPRTRPTCTCRRSPK